ncbi:hypothetical protein WJX81_000695 [Elliptochloris bilobata]|uniref:FAD-binding PCMH-type domain-containing protein n=1 Tax=Elliptochloris bilobata TaxID=381761 RepID=A0AAW1RZR7_9CHLO
MQAPSPVEARRHCYATGMRRTGPESLEELEQLVADAHAAGGKLRCVGSYLSPNGLAFCEEGQVSLALMDRVLAVDAARRQVTVQAGARVQEVVEQLRPHGLTLQNYASIREQSIGGFTQVGAHGTGAAIPPVDETIVGLTLVTPGQGTLRLSADADPELFELARVGLGALGVVAEVTLQCVPAHQLLEHTFVSTLKEVKRKHARWLRDNQHIRYMWIPYSDAVVVVTNNPVREGSKPPQPRITYTEDERRAPLRALLAEAAPDPMPDPAPGPATDQARGAGEAGAGAGGGGGGGSYGAPIEELSGTQLRDRLIAVNPLDRDWIARVNQADAEHWRRSEGYRVGWSDQLLGFDCGGQQWVLEVAFPTGTLRQPSGADLAFMEELLADLMMKGIAAPAPIEQRWTASSRSPMSPASAPGAPDTVHSWVGIIMYLPTEDAAQRTAITDAFFDYCRLLQDDLMPRYGATEHWAKIEAHRLEPASVSARLAVRFPVERFNAARAALDPKNIMANDVVDILFPRSKA